MNSWFDLVKEKNQLLRTENKLMIEQRELQLQVNYEDYCTSSSFSSTDEDQTFPEYDPDCSSPPFCQRFWV